MKAPWARLQDVALESTPAMYNRFMTTESAYSVRKLEYSRHIYMMPVSRANGVPLYFLFV